MQEDACLVVKVTEEAFEGGHVGGLEHTALLPLLWGIPAVGYGSIQNPSQVMTRVLHCTYTLPPAHHCCLDRPGHTHKPWPEHEPQQL